MQTLEIVAVKRLSMYQILTRNLGQSPTWVRPAP